MIISYLVTYLNKNNKFIFKYSILFIVLILINKTSFTQTNQLDYINKQKESTNINDDLLKENLTSQQESGYEIIFNEETTILNRSDLFVNTFDLEDESPYKVYSLPAKITLSILALTASLITVSGNLLVMFSFFLDRQIRNPTNYFILSLSVSDFIIGLVSMPFLTLYLMVGKWPFGEIICNLWLSLDYTVCLTSIYTVLFITIDRFCSVKIPAKYRKWRSPNKIVMMVMMTWVIPSCLFFTSIFAWSYGSNAKFDPKNCDVAWSSNKIFSVTLVFSYFWTTLIVIIVLYIFIYQVARNLERKSREKQRKLSSLVGCSASNTGALVGVVVVPSSNGLKGKKINDGSGSIEDNNDDNDDDFIESQAKSSTKIKNKLKEPLKLIKGSSKSGAALLNNDTNKNINHTDMEKLMNNKLNKSIETTASLSNTTSSNNNESNQNQTKTKNMKKKTNLNSSNESKIEQNQIKNFNSKTTNVINDNKFVVVKSCVNSNSHTGAKKKTNQKNLKTILKANNNSYASTLSRDDEFSSSYDSHSDYDNAKQIKVASTQTVVKTINNHHKNSIFERKLSKQQPQTTVEILKPIVNEQLSITSQSLQPRPESLAIMTHDQFAEKCATAKQQSSICSKKLITQQNDLSTDDQNENNKAPNTIPFIDEEYDELSYVLTRRQFGDKENRIPIKEERILIKSSNRNSFFQKISTPIKNLSRRGSQKSQNDSQTTNATTNMNKFDLLSNQFNEKNKSGVEQANNIVTCDENCKLLPDSEKSKKNSLTSSEQLKDDDNKNNNQNSCKIQNQQSLNISISNAVKVTPSSTLTAISSTTGSNSPCLTNSVKTTMLEKQQSILSKPNSDTEKRVGLAGPVSFAPGTRQALQKRKNKHENRARKALRTITFILGAFICCFAPWHVVSIYNSFCPDCFNSNLYHHFFYSCYFLCYLNSPINPFMYALANQQFKKTFFRILKGDWRRL